MTKKGIKIVMSFLMYIMPILCVAQTTIISAGSAMQRHRYILSGGPCSGKSTVIKILKEQGFQTIEEAFSSSYEYAKNHNQLHEFWGDPGKRNANLITAQIVQEQMLEPSKIALLDRSIFDISFFSEYYQAPLAFNLLDLIQEQRRNYANFVFFLDPLPEDLYEQSDRRRENWHEAQHIHQLLKDYYLRHGFALAIVPFAAPIERVLRILRHVEKKSV